MSTRVSRIWEQIMAKVKVSECPDTDPWWTNPDTGETTPCWIWTGADSGGGRGGGYGRIAIDGHSSAVHRVVYTMVHGYLPAKRQVDHLCQNRLCCNPEHLEDVTHKQNQRRRRKANK